MLNRLAMYAVGGLLLAGVIFLGYKHYVGLVEDNAVLRENQVKLTTALEDQKNATAAAVSAIEDWKSSLTRFQALLDDYSGMQVQAKADLRRLNDLFTDHDLTQLARKRPGLIERRVDDGTAASLRMLECESAGGSDCAGAGGPASPEAASPQASPD